MFQLHKCHAADSGYSGADPEGGGAWGSEPSLLEDPKLHKEGKEKAAHMHFTD